MKNYGLLTVVMISLIALFFTACNKDETVEASKKPVITLDSETGIYKAKVGRAFIINPSVVNNEGAVYRWSSGTDILGTNPTLTYTLYEPGAFYITFRVSTDAGEAEKELRVDVGELAPPVISIAIPSGGMKLLAGEIYTIEPDVQNDEGAVFGWYEGTELVGNTKTYDFIKEVAGTYELTLKVINEDGRDEKTIPIEVVNEYPLNITFIAPLYGGTSTDKSAFSGKGLYLKPIVENADNPEYSWSIAGEGEVAQTLDYMFLKQTEGEYELTFTVTADAAMAPAGVSRNITRSGRRFSSVTLNVTVYGTEASRKRPSGSKKYFEKVYEYVPAPGQFINDPNADFEGESTMGTALAYAQRRMENNLDGNGMEYVSLGGFGGYIVVGFDHSIENKGGFSGYDFSIVGNQFSGGSELGIVWVMQDVNGNGEPDDEWYELKGSESGSGETVYNYAVTYFKPAAPKMAVQWIDNIGHRGTIDYDKVAPWHRQDYFYPAWIDADSYTLYGTRLKDKTYLDSDSGRWVNGDFDWGYADNWGSDRLSASGNPNADPNKVYFKISNAVYPDGNPANLKYVDFIKVQTGVNASADLLGENSTEVYGFFDENMQ